MMFDMSNMRNYKKETRKYNFVFFVVVSGDTSSCFQSVMLLGLRESGETQKSKFWCCTIWVNCISVYHISMLCIKLTYLSFLVKTLYKTLLSEQV